MKLNIILVFLFLASCNILNRAKNVKTCKYENYYYMFDNSETINNADDANILKNDHDVGIVFTFTEYGESFKDSTYFSLTRMTYDSIKPCLEYRLFFDKSDTLKCMKIEDDLITFVSKTFNKHICNNDKLILEVNNKCSKRKKTYYLVRKEGEQEYPIHH